MITTSPTHLFKAPAEIEPETISEPATEPEHATESPLSRVHAAIGGVGGGLLVTILLLLGVVATLVVFIKQQKKRGIKDPSNYLVLPCDGKETLMQIAIGVDKSTLIMCWMPIHMYISSKTFSM